MGVVSPGGDLGPCEVWYGTSGAEAKIGETFGETIFRTTTEARPVHEDAKGVAPVDHVKVGMSMCEVEVPLTRMSFANLATILPGASNSGGESGNLQFISEVGSDSAADGLSLVLKRIVNGVVTSDETDWLTLPVATVITMSLELRYDTENQRVFTVVFAGYPNDNGVYWYYGTL